MDLSELYMEPICNYSLSHAKRVSLDITRGSAAAVSTFLLLLSLVLLLCYKLYRDFTYRLVLYLLLSTLLYSVVTIFQLTAIWYEREGTIVAHLCEAVGFGLTYSNWTVVLFKLYVVVEVLCALVFLREVRERERWEVFIVVTLIVVPFLFSWVPFVTGTFGFSGAWCWIRKKNDNCTDDPVGFYEQMGLWYGPLFILMAALSIMIGVIIVVLVCRSCKTRRRSGYIPIEGSNGHSGHEHVGETRGLSDSALTEEAESHSENEPLDEATKYKKLLKEMLPLLGYPIIYILTHLIALADRIVRFAAGGSPYWLVMFHAATNPAGGLFASVFFMIHLAVLGKKGRIRVKLKLPRSGSRSHQFANTRGTERFVTDRTSISYPTVSYDNVGESDLDRQLLSDSAGSSRQSSLVNSKES